MIYMKKRQKNTKEEIKMLKTVEAVRERERERD